jgi:hypothetical protein
MPIPLHNPTVQYRHPLRALLPEGLRALYGDIDEVWEVNVFNLHGFVVVEQSWRVYEQPFQRQYLHEWLVLWLLDIPGRQHMPFSVVRYYGGTWPTQYGILRRIAVASDGVSRDRWWITQESIGGSVLWIIYYFPALVRVPLFVLVSPAEPCYSRRIGSLRIDI